jgi:hypothetical protein
MASEIHVGDIGTQLIMTVKDDGVVVDISSASVLNVIIKKPSGQSYTKTGVVLTDGTDGKMYYTSISGDFDAPGLYKIQGRVILNDSIYYTSISSFKVYCNL